jgi:hypothetical protein
VDGGAWHELCSMLSIMRRTVLFSLVLLTFMGSIAFADRDRRRDRGYHSRDRGATVVRHPQRDHRRAPVVVDRRAPRRVIERRPIHVQNGHYRFHNGVTRTYNRPVIRQRYVDYRVRPQIIVEHYDPVPGYVWMQGSWQWSGYEWQWVPGYYAPDASYTFYDDGHYYDGRAYYRW